MTTQDIPAGTAPATGTSAPATPSSGPAPASWPWRRGALILAAAARLITISALLSADPLAAGGVKLWHERS